MALANFSGRLVFVIPTKEESEYKILLTNALHPDSSFVGMTKSDLPLKLSKSLKTKNQLKNLR